MQQSLIEAKVLQNTDMQEIIYYELKRTEIPCRRT